MERAITGKYADTALGILRIVAGLLFMQHGAPKLFGAFGGFGGQPGATAPLFSLMGLAGVLEIFGGAMIALGLFTRIVAFVLAGEMAVAYFKAHFPESFFPMLNGGEPAALFCFIFLFLAAAGGGRFSLDRALFRGREPSFTGLRSTDAVRHDVSPRAA